MEYPRDWVITTTGKVVRRDKAKPNDVIEEKYIFDTDEYANSFLEKDEACSCLEQIIEAHPTAFLPKDEQPKQSERMPRKKIVEQDEFRDLMRDELLKRMDEVWACWPKLSPRDKCDFYYKMMSFAYSKAPSEKVVDPAEAAARKADSKRAEAANRIAQGIDNIEDTDFEE